MVGAAVGVAMGGVVGDAVAVGDAVVRGFALGASADDVGAAVVGVALPLAAMSPAVGFLGI